MKCNHLIILVVMVFLLAWNSKEVSAQNEARSLVEMFDRYVPFGFKSQLQWDSIRENLIDPSEESFKYDSLLKEKTHKYLLYPFWFGYEYQQLQGLKTEIDAQRLGYFAYVLSPKIGPFNTSYSWPVKSAVDSELFKDIPIDLVMYCRGRHETELFLQSDVEQLDCIENVYSKLKVRDSAPNLRKADGVNIYFQDLSLDMISEFKEFVFRFSNYNVFDSINNKYEIYLTLPTKYMKISSQLLDMQDFVDVIFYADYNEFGICEKMVEPLSKFEIKPIDFNDAYDRYQAYHYRSPLLWSFVRKQYAPPNDELAYYTSNIKDTIQEYMIYPYWLGNMYNSLPDGRFDSISRMAYMGYVIDPLTGNASLNNAWAKRNVFDEKDLKLIEKDLLIYCRGEAATHIFLDSDSARINCIKNIFSLCSRSQLSSDKDLVNPDGITIYFPDFSFEKKREFAQFIKSIRLVKDTLVKDISGNFICPYKKLQLNIIFPKRQEKEKPYLSCLLQYVDAIYFADFDQFGLVKSDTTSLTKGSVETGLFREIRNQFYMFRFAPFYNEKMDVTEVKSIVDNAIRDNKWELYLFSILFLILVLLLIPLAYFTECRFHEFIQKYIVHTFIIILMFLMEILLLFMFMIEEMSTEIVFFDSSGSTRFLLLLPIVIVVIYPLISSIQKKSALP